MSESDWDTVTYLRKKPPKASQLRTQQNQNYQRTSCFSDGQVKHFDTCPPGQAINAAQRQGIAIETTKKYNAATNKQHQTSMNTAKLDRETEQLHHDTVGLEIGRLIQQGRQNKNLTQKDLATRINEKPQVINDYEAGRAVPNQQILTKIERIIGIKLRGREKGQSLSDQKPKKK